MIDLMVEIKQIDTALCWAKAMQSETNKAEVDEKPPLFITIYILISG